MRKRTSIIWKIPIKELKKIVSSCDSMANIVKHFGFAIASGNYKTLKKRLDEENIDYSHIRLGLNNNKGRKFPPKAISLEEVMIENSTYSRGSLKKRLLKNGTLENKCGICSQDEIWNDQKLIMVLDHKNGKRDDHRLENLRMLCPNCNSQQKTFAGKNLRKKYNCIQCGKKTTRKRKYCDLCCKENNTMSQRKVERPSKEQLLKEIEETNYCAVGRKYGVSDNAIRKWVKQYGLLV